jgi:hypothetical protein
VTVVCVFTPHIQVINKFQMCSRTLNSIWHECFWTRSSCASFLGLILLFHLLFRGSKKEHKRKNNFFLSRWQQQWHYRINHTYFLWDWRQTDVSADENCFFLNSDWWNTTESKQSIHQDNPFWTYTRSILSGGLSFPLPTKMFPHTYVFPVDIRIF